jgi:broad specificity phosphatase PhoE
MKTIILLRHADITVPASGNVPDSHPLNTAGKARATDLLNLLRNAGITSIFVSAAKRTQQTAAPIVAATGLTTTVQGDPAQLVPLIRAAAAGDTVLVVGHSNTVPQIITALGAVPPAAVLQGHADLFIFTSTSTESRLLQLKYGKPSP